LIRPPRGVCVELARIVSRHISLGGPTSPVGGWGSMLGPWPFGLKVPGIAAPNHLPVAIRFPPSHPS
jgi:hypothetical protein